MREYYITDDGIRLHIKLDMPVGWPEDSENGKCPLAIVIHGLTGNMEERHIRAVARLMNELGAASLRVEMFGHGQSEGDFEQHNLFKWLNNAMTVADHAASLDFVSDLYVCGHSQGGLTTIMLAGMKPELFRAAIPLSPATMIAEAARGGRSFGTEFDPDHIPEEIYVNSEQKVSGNYLRAAQMLDVDYAIKRYKGPVLIVHGSDDEAVPLRCAEEAARKYNNAGFAVIEGDDHCYNYHLDKMLEAVKRFMETVMR